MIDDTDLILSLDDEPNALLLLHQEQQRLRDAAQGTPGAISAPQLLIRRKPVDVRGRQALPS